MRLIDADKFKSQIAGMAISNNYHANKANALCELIDAQPTAYDPDKVVRQLEEIRPEEDCFDNAEEYKHALSRHNKIIEIVKGGGVDGN